MLIEYFEKVKTLLFNFKMNLAVIFLELKFINGNLSHV